jgi:hypothetical protein
MITGFYDKILITVTGFYDKIKITTTIEMGTVS